MRSYLLFALPLLAGVSTAALAEDTAPPPAFTITGGATLISDYRFRGISQTNKRFAIQGTLGVSHESGFYVGTWGSSIDDYVASGSDQEIDLYGGYKHTWSGTTVDMGVLYYYYPGAGHGVNTDFFEPYINASHTFGPVSAKLGANFSWSQKALAYTNAKTGVSHTDGTGFYGYGELSAAVPGTGVTLTGHLGHSFSRNYITFGTEYTDWSLTAAYTWKQLTLSVAYVDTSGKAASFSTGTGRNPIKAGVVAGIGVAF